MLIGDSVVFDHGLAGGRSNSIVPLVNDVVHRRFPEVTIDNRAARGLSTLHAINPASPTLRPYLSTLLDDTTDPPDLILIAVSAIDLNLFPDIPVATLWPPLLAELDGVRDLVEAHGVQVAFLPAFGASETMYERYRSLSGTAVPPYPINHRIDSFNELLAASDLPLLFRRFAGLDSDHDGDTDERCFAGHDLPESGSPDDGVHPNGLGERIYADNLARALITPLERRMHALRRRRSRRTPTTPRPAASRRHRDLTTPAVVARAEPLGDLTDRPTVGRDVGRVASVRKHPPILDALAGRIERREHARDRRGEAFHRVVGEAGDDMFDHADTADVTGRVQLGHPSEVAHRLLLHADGTDALEDRPVGVVAGSDRDRSLRRERDLREASGVLVARKMHECPEPRRRSTGAGDASTELVGDLLDRCLCCGDELGPRRRRLDRDLDGQRKVGESGASTSRSPSTPIISNPSAPSRRNNSHAIPSRYGSDPLRNARGHGV